MGESAVADPGCRDSEVVQSMGLLYVAWNASVANLAIGDHAAHLLNCGGERSRS